MNTKFLEFTQPFLEEMYQRHKAETLFTYKKVIAVSLMMYSIIRFITVITQFTDMRMFQELIFATYCIAQTIIAFRGGEEKFGYVFSLTTNILVVLQLQEQWQDSQSTYLNGQMVMVYNMFMLTTISFKYAIVEIVIFIVARIVIQANVTQFHWEQMVMTMICAITILYYVYMFDGLKRKAFQYQFTDQQWEKLLPMLIQNPFVLFNFDAERNNFEVKICNDLKLHLRDWDENKMSGENLRTFLRTYFVNGQNIEQFILQKNAGLKDSSTKMFRSSVTIVRGDQVQEQKQLLIQYSQFYLDEKVFLIVFDQTAHKVKSLENIKEALIHGITQHQELTLNFLRKQLQLISFALTQTAVVSHLHKLKIHCMYFQGKYTHCNSFHQIEEELQSFSLNQHLQATISMYQSAYEHLTIEMTSEIADITLVSNVKLVSIFFISILQTLVRDIRKQETIYIHLNISSTEVPYVQIFVKHYNVKLLVKILSENKLFEKIQTRISPKSEISLKNDSNIVYILGVALFIIYKDIQKLNELRQLQEDIE